MQIAHLSLSGDSVPSKFVINSNFLNMGFVKQISYTRDCVETKQRKILQASVFSLKVKPLGKKTKAIVLKKGWADEMLAVQSVH